MEFKYSRLIDPSEYESQGLCEGIPLRMHNEHQNEGIGTLRCQRDWNRLVEPLPPYNGGLSPKYSFMAISVPECLPERLEIISYANEFAFLYDDKTEFCNQNQLDASNDILQATFLEGASKGIILEKSADGKKEMQALMLKEMMAIDKERALTAVKSWAEFLRLAGGRQHERHFATLEEYIPYRSIDVGKWFWYGIVTFGMAITIPPHEMTKMEELMVPAWAAAALQNDIFSWTKERESAKKYGKKEIVNAVWVLMGEHSIGEEEALEKLRDITKSYVKEYVEIAEREIKNENHSIDLRRYLETILYSLSGNAVWSIICPRYNSGEEYNESRSPLMQNQISIENKKRKNQPEEFDVEDGHENGTNKEPQNYSKVRRTLKSSVSVDLNIANGNTANGNSPKRRKIEKRHDAFGSNGIATKGNTANPRATIHF